MGLIACAAYRNDEFRKITGTKTYIIPPTNKHTEDTPLYNHHAMLHPFKSYSQFVNQDCTGGKTGYTSVANSTLVTYAEKDGLTLCVVIMMRSRLISMQTQTRCSITISVTSRH